MVGLIGSSIDITARKETEARLAESEERFRNMADHAPVMMWVTDPSGRCTYLNRVWFEFTGQADHAGTTRMEDRHDPILTYAMTVLAANKQARLSGQRATFGRLAVRPNGTNAVPSAVTAWLTRRPPC